MNYRHAFHAGNVGDVLKHIVLARVLERLKAKPAPFRVLDIHAGIGLYDLTAEAAERTGEWTEGVGRLYAPGTLDPLLLDAKAEPLLAPWRKAIRAVNDGARLAHYPGSPELARWLARDQDRIVANELHAEDHLLLARRYARDRRVRVLGLDALVALKSQLPPPERRGVVLIDPPYEVADEAKRTLAGLAEGLRRFATGTFLVWYPVKAQADAHAFARRAASLAPSKMMRMELTVRRADRRDSLNGSGLIVVNPPWKLEGEMKTILPALAHRLADPAARFAGGWRLEWLQV